MDFYKALFEIARTIHCEMDQDRLPRLLLERVIDFTAADKGFIVIKEQGSFQEKYHVHFDRDLISARKRKFSRTLVREAITKRRIIFSEDITTDPRFIGTESVIRLGSCSALVTPIEYLEQVQGVIYMERRTGDAPFTQEDQAFMDEFSNLAGAALHRALELKTLERLREIHDRDFLTQHNFDGIIGRHPKMIHLFETIVQVAKSDAIVLIHGETGTGKELIAQSVYLNSERKDRPYVTLHCGALPETLFEAELFGHRRGAFTGAHQDRAGRIATANGGTLFLDEIAEIPLATQAKLLRFIQYGEYQRVGSDHVERVDIRIIAATHKDLAKMVEQGKFRQDLYFRLNVLELEVPPLRERKSDILLLVNFFLKKYWPGDRDVPVLSAEALAALEKYSYPGNVRELSHIVERLCVLARDSHLDLSLLPRALQDEYREKHAPANPPTANKTSFSTYSNEELKAARDRVSKAAVAEVEKIYLAGLLERCDGNISRAAEMAGMQRPYLHRLLAKYRP